MANHVDNYITCEGSKKTMKIWKLLFSSYGETLQRPSYHGDGVINIWEYKEIQKHPFMGEGYDDHTNWRRWNDKNIGAKWAHIEEADEDSVRIVSAWRRTYRSCTSTYTKQIKQLQYDILMKMSSETFLELWSGVTWKTSGQSYLTKI